MAGGYRHEDLSSCSVYTEAELMSWSEKIMYGNLHSAIVKSLTLGVCNNQGTCPVASETPAYNLNNLLTTEGQLADELNPMKKVTNWIEKNTGYICIIDLLAIGLKFLINCANIGVTMVQEGAAGVLALLYVVWCQTRIHSKRIIRKGRRKRRAEDPSEDHLLNKINEDKKL